MTNNVSNNNYIPSFTVNGKILDNGRRDISDISKKLFKDGLVEELTKYSTTLNDLKNRLTVIQAEKKTAQLNDQGSKVGRFFRSFGVVILYTLGIALIVPAAAALILGGRKVIDFADRNITLKSPEEMKLDSEANSVQEQMARLYNPKDIKVHVTYSGNMVSVENMKIDAALKEILPGDEGQELKKRISNLYHARFIPEN